MSLLNSWGVTPRTIAPMGRVATDYNPPTPRVASYVNPTMGGTGWGTNNGSWLNRGAGTGWLGALGNQFGGQMNPFGNLINSISGGGPGSLFGSNSFGPYGAASSGYSFGPSHGYPAGYPSMNQFSTNGLAGMLGGNQMNPFNSISEYSPQGSPQLGSNYGSLGSYNYNNQFSMGRPYYA